MISAVTAFKEFPYYPQFTFSSIAASTNNQVQLLIPHNIAVYGIAITAKDLQSDHYYSYRLQFQNYDTGDTLFDEPIQTANIQCGCVGYVPDWPCQPSLGGAWLLPSKWFIKKNQKIICSLNTFASSTTENYYVTLLAYTTDVDPNPGIQPFVYSFPMRMGFQDNTSGAGGQTSVNFNQQITNTLAKPMIHDFELHSIVLDPYGTTGMAANTLGAIPHMALQISWPGRKLFDRFVINGVAGGGATFSQDGAVFLNSGGNFGFPDSNIIQYKLARPERICKGQIVRVDISPAPTYLNSSDMHNAFNEQVCMALIGNHYAS